MGRCILVGPDDDFSCKQIEHDVNFSKAKEAVSTVTLDLEIRKEEYAQVCSTEKKKLKGNQEKAHLLPPIPYTATRNIVVALVRMNKL